MITATELLTPREKEILMLVSKGIPNRQLGDNLATPCCEKTIKIHLMHIREKLGAQTTAQAAILAFKQGIIE